MIEKVILDYLNNELDVPVYMERPKTPPTSYVLIEKTGGGEDNYIKHATLAIQSISTTLYNTASLNETVKELMKNAVIVDDVAKVSLNSDYNYTDSSTKEYRYQAVFDITHY